MIYCSDEWIEMCILFQYISSDVDSAMWKDMRLLNFERSDWHERDDVEGVEQRKGGQLPKI